MNAFFSVVVAGVISVNFGVFCFFCPFSIASTFSAIKLMVNSLTAMHLQLKTGPLYIGELCVEGIMFLV